MKIAAAALLGLVSSHELFLNNSGLMTHEDYEFIKYVANYGKSYGTKAEFEFRAAEFKRKLAQINAHNAENGTSTVGVNEFTDMTPAEFKRMLGFKGAKAHSHRNVAVLSEEGL
jgi:cathepsin F